jgi:GNAT superfamily N-acetyltransferase
MATAAVEIVPAKFDGEVKAGATFFVDAFWSGSTTTGPAELSTTERSQLVSQQCDDMMGRYGELVGTRRLKSQMLLARDAAGAIIGCVGLEMALIQPQMGTVLSRAQSDAILVEELSSMGARERNTYRKMDAVELTSALFPEYQCYALLANLAVATSARGSGLGRELCELCDDIAKVWGVEAIMLQVEGQNAPARGLYERVGYQDVHVDENAAVLRVRPGSGGGDALLQQETAPLVLMGKGLA